VHCGFYDAEVLEGVYESHVNFFVVAESFEEARVKAKQNPLYQNKRMHIDGLQQLDAIDGHRIHLELDRQLDGRSRVVSHKYRGLAPRKSPDRSSLH
jgi:hypothetical protein